MKEGHLVGISMIGFAVVALSGAQLLIKSRLSLHGVTPWNPRALTNYAVQISQDGYAWLGALGLIVSAFFWYAGMSRLPLSVAFPIAAMSYPLIALGSVKLLGEQVTTPLIMGNLLIVVGVVLLARG